MLFLNEKHLISTFCADSFCHGEPDFDESSTNNVGEKKRSRENSITVTYDGSRDIGSDITTAFPRFLFNKAMNWIRSNPLNNTETGIRNFKLDM